MKFAVVDLRDQESWSPLSLLPPEPLVPLWPQHVSVDHSIPLIELIRVLTPRARTGPATRVVRPADIDPMSGVITGSIRASSAVGFRLGEDLEVGDVLISGDRPAVLVTEQLGSTYFSPAFMAVRPSGPLGLVLWAMLSASSGVQAWLSATRRDVSSTNPERVKRQNGLESLSAPDPLPRPSAEVHGLAQRTVWNPRTQPVEDSWYRIVDSNALVEDWSLALAHPQMDSLLDGPKLSLHVESAVRGRHINKSDRFDSPAPGLLPYMTPAGVRDGEPTHYVPAESSGDRLAEPGDVLVSIIGSRFPSRAVTECCVPSEHVAVLQPASGVSPETVAGLLNLPSTQSVMRTLARGATIQRISPKDLLNVPAPDVEEAATFALSIGEQLERGLWG